MSLSCFVIITSIVCGRHLSSHITVNRIIINSFKRMSHKTECKVSYFSETYQIFLVSFYIISYCFVNLRQNLKIMNNGYFRAAAVSPKVRPSDVDYNTARISECCHKAAAGGAKLIVTPELAITGYTCADLFHNKTLIDAALDALSTLAEATADIRCAISVGIPMTYNDSLYNCAAVICGGTIAGVVPKQYLPSYNEFYEKRWFASGRDVAPGSMIQTRQGDVPFGNLIFEYDSVRFGIEICEDLWTAIPPSTHLALQGATVIANLSASDDLSGKYDYLKSLIKQQSARCRCGYVYASAGFGESSTDLVFDGKGLIAENGYMLCDTPRWQDSPLTAMADIDIMALTRDRMHTTSFADSRAADTAPKARTIILETEETPSDDSLLRKVSPLPFVPAGDALESRCVEITNIQAAGLAQRLNATGCKTLVVGISGGLDSTLALLVACKAFDRLKLPRTGIIGVTMPGFGTTGRTHSNACDLMKALGVTFREIPIAKAVEGHFRDIGHDPKTIDVTYENSQARERTQILMDVANQENGMVLGTGDLSELALGWATYNGDQMSMYGVNASVPKTLVRHLVKHFADMPAYASAQKALLDIVDTPISPELTPADKDGNIAQKTEDLVGPYELHDFFLYYTLRFGFPPARIYFLARKAFEGSYDNATILKWMHIFYRRFFTQQFKRSCMPDGPKTGNICLSPRGDWRMPSDASSKLWLKQVDELRPD